MLRVLAKINCVTILFPLVVSQYVNTSVEVKLPGQYEEIRFRAINEFTPATLGLLPYQVSIKKSIKGGYYINTCSGSLIAPKKILSAAQCFTTKGNYCQKLCKKIQMRSLKSLYAVAGSLDYTAKFKKDGQGSEQWRRMSRAAVAPGYKYPKNDIGVAFTSKSFVINENVKTLPYATLRTDYYEIVCVVSRYGKKDKTAKTMVLLNAQMKLLSKIKCKNLHGRNMNDFICLDHASNAVTLQGNYGGPLVCKNTVDKGDKGQGVIVGVVSGARKKKNKWRPYYTRVSSHRNFVRKKAARNLPLLTRNIVWISFIMSNFGWCFV